MRLGIFTIILLILTACTQSNDSLTKSPELSTEQTNLTLPDLVASSVWVRQTGKACTSQTTVIVENVGYEAATTFTVKMNQTEQIIEGGLPAGKMLEVYFTDGPGTVSVLVDSGNAIAENNETNNRHYYAVPFTSAAPNMSCTPNPEVTATPTLEPMMKDIDLNLPDLMIQDVASCKEPTGVVVTVGNYGRVDSGAFDISAGGNVQQVDNLKAGQSRKIVFNGVASFSNIAVDSNRRITERHEGNNIWEAPLYPVVETQNCS